ncbi:hypothetical protein JT358_11615 [Micrococcales bacterium 31B]|nr:hypothetical protein [Micrococcales bacterium 31B]
MAEADIARRISHINAAHPETSAIVVDRWARRLAALKQTAAESAMKYLAALDPRGEGDGALHAGTLHVSARAFGEATSRGAPLSLALKAPLETAATLVDRGAHPLAALTQARHSLITLMRTEIADTARNATSAGMAIRGVTSYVRMLNPPSCPRCIILAGKWFRWNEGFARHPRCDCVHIPVSEAAAGDLTTDPYQAFWALTPPEQDRLFGRGGAAAIREGADINQVVNARRGLALNRLTTSEGLAARRGGHARDVLGSGRRLSPDGILRAAGTDQARYVELLRRNGYLLEQGQVAGGAIRGARLSDAEHAARRDARRAERRAAQRAAQKPPRPAPVLPDAMTRMKLLDAKALHHIVYGEPLTPGVRAQGGHLSGLGRPEKTEFPPNWGPGRIAFAVMKTARAPEGTKLDADQWKLTRHVDGVDVTVVFIRWPGHKNVSFYSAFPLPGTMTHRNPPLQP